MLQPTPDDLDLAVEYDLDDEDEEWLEAFNTEVRGGTRCRRRGGGVDGMQAAGRGQQESVPEANTESSRVGARCPQLFPLAPRPAPWLQAKRAKSRKARRTCGEEWMEHLIDRMEKEYTAELQVGWRGWGTCVAGAEQQHRPVNRACTLVASRAGCSWLAGWSCSRDYER